MSNMLRPPSVGPIVGHTTDHSVRVWMRGADEVEGRTIGIAALYLENDKYVKGSAQYFRLRREYDRTGTIDFPDLKPETTYTVRLGSLTLDSADEMADVEDEELWNGKKGKLPAPDVWLGDLQKLPETESTARFLTFPAAARKSFSFLFGSCRYPGLVGTAKGADKIFGAMHERCQTGENPPRFVLMVGDQIYADKMNKAIPLGRADTPSEFHERYVTAFSSPNMRALLRSVPNFMILDDHEIEDNWVQTRIGKEEKRLLFQTAISAYMSYQWAHGPRNYDKRGWAADFFGRQLFYSFDFGSHPFFVIDGRTQRIRDDEDNELDDNHLLGYPARPAAPGYPGQIDLLCDWLIAQQGAVGNRPKFIVTPSVFVPNGVETASGAKTHFLWITQPPNPERARRKKCEDDAWAAFPATRAQLLRTIVDNGVQNVVFLSGDVHCSNVAEITFHKKSDNSPLPLQAWSITSSAFYWPWSFADGDPLSFVHDSQAEGDGFDVSDSVVMHYHAYNFEQEDNFTQVEVHPSELIVRNFNAKGELLPNFGPNGKRIGTIKFNLVG